MNFADCLFAMLLILGVACLVALVFDGDPMPFVGQLNRLMRENEKKARTGDTLEIREKARHCANFIEELMNMPASHKLSAEKLLATAAPTEPRPVQVG